MSIWNQCLDRLQQDMPIQQFSMWIRPLQAEQSETHMTVFAPNRFVLDWVRDKYFAQINDLLAEFCGDKVPHLRFEVRMAGTEASRGFANNMSHAPANANKANSSENGQAARTLASLAQAQSNNSNSILPIAVWVITSFGGNKASAQA